LVRRWLVAAAVVLIALGLVAWYAAGPLLSPKFEEHVRRTLGDYFGGQAELQGVRVTLFPRPQVTGEGFLLRHRGRTDIPPLVQIGRFTATATWTGMLQRPRRVRVIRLEGLRLHIPSRRPGEKLLSETLGGKAPPATPEPDRRASQARRTTPVIVERIETPGARLEIANKDPAKESKLFDIHALTLRSVALDRPMQFDATLTNPKPPGPITTTGEFGPFDSDEPGDTPLHGTYTFAKADLGVFKGIAGILSSKGAFKGVLERIEVEGETSTPDFQVKLAGNPVTLRTRFRAVVDGTNGDTFLVPVDASFLESHLTARGGVYKREGVKGREVALDVTIDRARIEDLLKLAMKGPRSLITGAATARTKLRIPPGEEDVIEKLELDGEFRIASAKFTDIDVQRTIAKLSARGRGMLMDVESGGSVVSDLAGRFVLKDGRLAFTRLTFSVPGVSVQLRGTYALRDEQLRFKGIVRLDAPLSKTTTGWKSVLLKVVDPIFRKKGAGAEIPIKVEGPRDKPKFGMDFGALMPGN
jgi:hypothetical protein